MDSWIRHLRRAITGAAVLVGVVGVFALAGGPASGASGDGPVVTMDVPSALNVGDAGCRDDDALKLGVVLPTQFAIGEPCEITFGSSNGAAQLRAWQRDGEGEAMQSTGGSWTGIAGTGNFYGIAARPGGKAWIGGAGGTNEPGAKLMYTDDHGATWTPQTPCGGTSGTVAEITALDDDLLYMVVGGRICRTEDGGDLWTMVHAGGVTRIDMVTPTLGFAIAGTEILKTSDGLTFTSVFTSTEFTYLRELSATATTILVVASNSALPTSSYGAIVSHDGGASWTEVVLNTAAGLDTSGKYGALVVDDDHMLAATTSYSGHTSNGGELASDWTQVQSYALYEGEPWIRPSDGRIFGQRDNGSFRYSDDDGITWTGVSFGIPVGQAIRNFAGIEDGSDTDLWAVGHSHRALHLAGAVEPYGAPWNLSYEGLPNRSVAVAWDRRRWVVTGSVVDKTVVTDDAGVTLETPDLDDDGPWRDGLMLDGSGAGLLVGDALIARTTDYGATWTSIDRPHAGAYWYAVERDSDGRLWMIGAAGATTHIAYSDTDGQSWTSAGTFAGFAANRMAVWRGRMWIGGADAAFAHTSTTLPLSWTSGTLPGRTGDTAGIWAIDETTAIYVTGYEAAPNRSYVSKTTNTGAGWTTSLIVDEQQFFSGFAFSEDHSVGHVLSSCGKIFTSRDDGSAWTNTQQGCGYTWDAQDLGGGRMLAVGENGSIYLRDPATTIPDGMGGPHSGFGICVEEAASVAITQWTPVGAGNCTAATPAGNWYGVPADPAAGGASIARTAPGTYGAVTTRFGLRAGSFAPANEYEASIVFEAIAPEL